eukprot:CAMPEP_0168750376 /NCGR_PEP_ID=MMETSP0724-20121128/17236_1 /TAXON_ID=265536 /ORGANISM="Amphiprora sp., Strain CCMP467" /LENGTH=688 /DNA_ID=CAMNT_0008798387 /DNA_START=117 /DNA_END=2183 /DNA_ORIENTATION=+
MIKSFRNKPKTSAGSTNTTPASPPTSPSKKKGFSFRLGGASPLSSTSSPLFTKKKKKKKVKEPKPARTTTSFQKKKKAPSPPRLPDERKKRPELVKKNSNPNLDTTPQDNDGIAQAAAPVKRKFRRFSIGTPQPSTETTTTTTATDSTTTTTTTSYGYEPNSQEDDYSYYNYNDDDGDADGEQDYGYGDGAPTTTTTTTTTTTALPVDQAMDQYYQQSHQQPHMAVRSRVNRRSSLDSALSMIQGGSTNTNASNKGNGTSGKKSASSKKGRVGGSKRQSFKKGGTTRLDEEAVEDEYSTISFLAKQAADMDHQANELSKKGKYEQAFMLYEKALELKRKMLQMEQKLQQQQDGCAMPATATQQLPMNNQTVVTPEQEDEMAGMLASVATSINNMTYLRQRGGQATADETMAAYIKSLQIKREILGPDHLSVGKTLSNIGSVFYLKKEYVPALKAFENALEIMTNHMYRDDLELGTVLSNLADVHFAMRHGDEALKYYKMAIDARIGPLGPTHPKVMRLLNRAAMLEMAGMEQPTDDASFSDDEEYMDEENRRREKLNGDVQALRDEVDQDIREINLEIFNQRSSSFLPRDDEDYRQTEELLHGDTNSSNNSNGGLQRPNAIAARSRTTGGCGSFTTGSVRHLQAFAGVRSNIDPIAEEGEEPHQDYSSSGYDSSDDSLSINSAPPDLQ